MRNYFTILFLLTSLIMYAQAPVNDDCENLIDLGIAPFCPSDQFFTNLNATESFIGEDNIPPCFNGGTLQRDVWFSFVASDTILDYTITVTGITDGNGSIPMEMPQIAVYRGECALDGFALLDCASAEINENIVEINLLGLTIGSTYFLRINDYNTSAAPNWGTFQLCVTAIQPVNTIDEGGSTLCSGELYDSGGPDSTYSNSEDFTYVICPSEANACITFNMTYYNIEQGGFGSGDQLFIYDGDDISSPLIADISNSNFTSSGGGAVCFSAQASSGCLTVQFISDGQVTLEGFQAAWECSMQPCEAPNPISVEETVTEDQIVASLSTPQTTAQVTNIDCPDGAYGTFTAPDNSDLGLPKGILLTSGTVQNSVGPNISGFITGGNGTPGDDELDYLSQQQGNGSLSNDACIVELDVYVATDELTFEYVFGSDEYPEFANSTFNDIFAFFISGPGIVGDPNINDQENIALIPNSTEPVQINSVNNLQNWQYYRNNLYGQSVEYDGLTSDSLGIKKSLTARRLVTPCSTYHLKLAIADRGDSSYDSGVFISDLKGGTPKLEAVFSNGIDYLIEGCTNVPDNLIISLSNPLEDTVSYQIELGGTATLGVDYTLGLPNSISFLPGQTEFIFPLSPIADLIEEGTETIEISLTNNFGCGDVVYTTLVINIEDEPKIIAVNGEDTVYVCQGFTVPLTVDGAVSYEWSPVGPLDNPISSNPICDPIVSEWFYVTGQIGLCSGNDSVYVSIIDPSILAIASDSTICLGDTIQLTGINNVGDAGIQWTPAFGLNDSHIGNPQASPNTTTTYTASVSIAGCTISDNIVINVDEFYFPDFTTLDTLICQTYSVDLGEDIIGTTVQYQWTPEAGLTDPTLSGPLATPLDPTIYTLTATSENGYCSQTESVNINVLPALVDIAGVDYYELCLGENIQLSVLTNTQGQGLMWEPNDGSLSSQTDTSVVATPLVSTWYYTYLDVGGCSVVDSVLIRVDSLPDLSMELVPMQGQYCPGQIITIVSQTYESSNFPDIQHLWSPADYTQSPLDNLNLVVTPDESVTYTRTTLNHACEETVSVPIVIVDPVLMINITDTTICAGETVQLSAPGAENYMWSPAIGMSCTDCPDPVVTGISSEIYAVTATIEDCPVGASVNINVVGAPSVSITADPGGEVPQGTEVTLTGVTNPDISQTGAFTWIYNSTDTVGTTYQIIVTPLEENNSYTVYVSDQNGCAGTATIIIPVALPTYEVPNAFSPNGDEINDLFHVVSTGLIQVNKMEVFNRWGQKVYSGSGTNAGWDGKFNGQEAASEVYVYALEIILPDGTPLELKGDLTLIR